jgi:hypothetical protein
MTTAETTANWRRRAFLGAMGAVGIGAIGVGATAAQNDGQGGVRRFTVRIENVSDASTLDTTEGTTAVPLSPGAYAVHASDEPIFTTGEPERDNGLEEIAEDGMPSRLVASLDDRDSVVASGAFTTPAGASDPAPIFPGDAYEFEVEAAAGRPTLYLSLVTMFIQSNDLFFALGGSTGLALFRNDDAPVAGDVTDSVGLYDAGTEINEEPGVGGDQAPRQRGANVGLVERGTVASIDDVNGYDYPAVADVVRVRITPN